MFIRELVALIATCCLAKVIVNEEIASSISR